MGSFGVKDRMIDHLFISHFDEDHCNGVDELLKTFEVKEIHLPYIAYIYRAVLNFMTNNGATSLFNTFVQLGLNPLAAFALMSDVLSNTTEKMYDDIIMLYFCELMKRVKEEELGIETRAWICGTIVSPNLYDKFLDAFLDLHFTELIPMTLTFDNGKEGYLIAKHDGLKALFDTNERYQKDMARWMEKKAFDADVLKQHKELVFLTSILNPKNRERYDAKKYPALQPYLKDDDFSCKFEEIKLNRSFWNDESRIKPKDSFVPIMDANK